MERGKSYFETKEKKNDPSSEHHLGPFSFLKMGERKKSAFLSLELRKRRGGGKIWCQFFMETNCLFFWADDDDDTAAAATMMERKQAEEKKTQSL